MTGLLFLFFSAITLLFGIGVVVNRNPVSSALCLVASFCGLAALFVQLEAYFIGVVQILVYAGAVMVLFLFIIMLLDLKAEERRKINPGAVIAGIVVVLLLGLQIFVVTREFSGERFGKLQTEIAVETHAVAASEGAGAADRAVTTVPDTLKERQLPDVNLVGETIFKRFAFPLQIVAVLLLVSTVGVVILSKRKLT